MLWGPDGDIWITQRNGLIARVDVRTGRVTPVGQLEVVEKVASGLMGMAFHPDFPKEPWVYLIHSFPAGGETIRNRLLRMRYENGRLGRAETLLEIWGNTVHNGSRLVIGPDRLLYVTMGDVGQPRLAQDTTSLNGKILRLTLDGKPAPGNPFGNEVWSWGHRNPEGLAFQPGTGLLYSTEHGPNTDDEINLIEKGKNYGWPDVRGPCNTPEELVFCATHEVAESLYEWTPTVGIAGATFYNHDLIPGWKGNLLATSLVGQSLFRITFAPGGRRISSVERLFENRFGRLRQVLVGPDGVVYLATSNQDKEVAMNTIVDHHDGRPLPGPFEGDDKILRVRP